MSAFMQRQGTPTKSSSYRGSVVRKYDSSDDDSSDDSDSDCEQSWKRHKTTSRLPVSHRPQVHDSHMKSSTDRRGGNTALNRGGGGGSRAGAKSRVNNVWGAIIQEQRQEQVEREITQFGMESDMQRDVESYNYKIDPDDEDRLPQLGLPAGIPIDGDASNRGRELQKGVGAGEDDGWLAERGSPVPSDEDDFEADVPEDLRKRITSRGMVADQIKRASVKSRLGSRPRTDESETPEMRSVEIDPNGEPKVVAGQLAYSLQEPKRDLMLRIVKTLGVEKCLQIWRKTEEIENDGGMMIRDRSRRRSPGGVFIQLMKTDPDVTKEDVKEIFAEEQKIFNAEKKKRKKQRMRKLAGVYMDVDRDRDKEKDHAGYGREMDTEKDNTHMETKTDVDFLLPTPDVARKENMPTKNEDSEPEEGELTDDDDDDGGGGGDDNITDGNVPKDDEVADEEPDDMT